VNESKSHPFWTDETMLHALHEWVAEHGKVPSSATDWKKAAYGRPSARACVVRFGSWSAFIRAGGYKPRTGGGAYFCDKIVDGRRAYWTKDTVAEWFLDHLLAHGEWPQMRQSRHATVGRRPSYSTVKNLFGSWVAAKRYAGWRGECECCGDPVWRSFQRFCSPRCRKLGPTGTVVERGCAGCGGDLASVTSGCATCSDRARKKFRRRTDPVYHAKELARLRARHARETERKAA